MATSSELLSYLKKKNLSQKAIGNIMGQYEAEGKHGNEENLNWSAKNLLMHFGDPGYTFTFRGKNYTVPSHRNKVRFKTLDDAQTTASQGAEAVGNVLYGGRMGNAADEGYKYRGRGAIQITGKNNYKALGEEFFLEGLVDDPNVFIDNPDLVNDPKFADKVPYHYFTGVKKVDPAKLDDPAIVHRAVGPSTGGVGSKEYLKRKEAGEKWSSIVSNTEALGSWDDTNPQTATPEFNSMEELLQSKGVMPNSSAPPVSDTYRMEGYNAPYKQTTEPVNINTDPTGLENPFLSAKNWWNSL